MQTYKKVLLILPIFLLFSASIAFAKSYEFKSSTKGDSFELKEKVFNISEDGFYTFSIKKVEGGEARAYLKDSKCKKDISRAHSYSVTDSDGYLSRGEVIKLISGPYCISVDARNTSYTVKVVN